MNNYIKTLAIGAAGLLCMTSCLKETEPTSFASEKQVQEASKDAISGGLPAYMISYASSSTVYYNAGFPAMMMNLDAMTADMPVFRQGYDYFWPYNTQEYLGSYGYSSVYWARIYALIHNANNVIAACADRLPADYQYLGNALCYRAAMYLDMSRLYEYKATGASAQDAIAEERGLYGLTVPIVTEETTETMGRNNPRVPFWHIYRFIQKDLDDAIELLKEYNEVTSKVYCARGVAYGIAARMWLEIGTRCELSQKDLDNIISHDDDKDLAEYPKLGITSATQAYAKAAEYARLAINCGYTPTTESEWFNPTTGFNTPTNGWMWCVTVSPDSSLALASWRNFISYICPECDWGVAQSYYGATRMCDASLYSTIQDIDWRKQTWIDPADVASEKAFSEKYSKGTNLKFSDWKEYAAYTGFKYHPANGDCLTYSVGNCVSTPLMRVEEMYYIEAEAIAHCQGLGAGVAALENFVNAYRTKNGTYTCSAGSLDDFDREVFRQKRIEFWGEGIILWDYKRHHYAVVKGYEGTNHVEEYRYNSYENRVAPWSIIYIPDSEEARNSGLKGKLNPDMTKAIPTLWKES